MSAKKNKAAGKIRTANPWAKFNASERERCIIAAVLIASGWKTLIG
jgi:hypothetical protein